MQVGTLEEIRGRLFDIQKEIEYHIYNLPPERFADKLQQATGQIKSAQTWIKKHLEANNV
jgi:hypothetical protein